MRDIAIVAFAQLPNRRRHTDREEVELVQPVVAEALKQVGLDKSQIGFTCSGSSDYLLGRPFSFVSALDAVAPWPPINESHVEMDGAWALYEAWVRLHHGDIDTALVYAYGKSSLGSLRDVVSQQLDPYYTAPLWPDAISLAALQARAVLDAGWASEKDFAEVASRNRARGKQNPNAHQVGDVPIDALLREPYLVEPLRKHDCPPISDGAACVILATAERARELVKRPAFIRGIDHRVEPHHLGMRDLTQSPSTRIAAERAGAAKGKLDVAELHAPFAHQELILRRALELGDDVQLNPSGGALAANPMMVAGLTRLGEAASHILSGDATRVLAHATSGPCLQQNLVAVMEAE